METPAAKPRRRRGRRGWTPALLLWLTLGVQAAAGAQSGPHFRPDGRDADLFGRAQGYPHCTALNYLSDTRCRVGAFSRWDQLFPSRAIAPSPTPSALRRAAVEPAIRYRYGGESRTVDDYLDSHAVTGLLIARGDEILLERYQYGRTDRDRLASFSMAKTIVGLLVGIALEQGAIRAIDDPAERYAPALAGTEYGRTPIKALLQMASGVAFSENYADSQSDIYALATHVLGQQPGGAAAALARFDRRVAPAGERFSYASSESLVLGLVLAGATGRTVADYAREMLWQPLGAEAEASWTVDATGQEITFAYYNAVLRDWARLGLMLAHGGEWAGRRIVPAAWIEASTKAGPDSPSPTYGYQVWLSPTGRNSFALRGLRGQWLLVHPGSKVVLVQTSVRDDGPEQLMPLWLAVAGDD